MPNFTLEQIEEEVLQFGTVRESWEALASLEVIPFDWILSDDRAFFCERSGRRSPFPLTQEMVVSIALHIHSMLTAEARITEILSKHHWPKKRILWKAAYSPISEVRIATRNSYVRTKSNLPTPLAMVIDEVLEDLDFVCDFVNKHEVIVCFSMLHPSR